MSERQEACDYEHDDRLERAFEHAANDLREIVQDLYSEVTNPYGGRIKAVWRGGDGLNVAINARTLYDFVTGESYNNWTFLTEVAGFDKRQAARYLLSRAGLEGAQPHVRARRQTKAKVATEKEKQREAYLKDKLEDAHEVQRTGPTVGSSAYFERKGITALFDTHEVPDGLLDGQPVPGMVYGSDRYGPYVQLALSTLDGTVTSYQRIYDGKVLPGGRDKDFIGTVGGAFVLLQPKGVTLPRDGTALARLLSEGYEVGTTEGVATGASVAMAYPSAFVFCALSSGNLADVLAALRERYGYFRRFKNARKALDLCIWADRDPSGNGQQKAHHAALKYSCYVRTPRREGDFNDLHQSEGLAAVRRTRKLTPDAKQAFAKELSKQRLSPARNLPPFDLPEPGAALIVRAPQESGKTHQLAETLKRQPLSHVLVVVHRDSLGKNLAKRLPGFEFHSDYPGNLLRDVPRLVICFDSLYKLALGGELTRRDLLVFDESEQVFEHTTGRHIKHKAANFAVLEQLLRETSRVLCLDANAGHLTVNAIRRANPTRRINWFKHEYNIAAGRRLRVVNDRDDAVDALEAETRPIWYATDSLRHSRNLSAYLDDPHTLTINSETAATDAAAAYLLDPTGQAPAHQRLIASPSVQTGFSDDSGRWQSVIGSFSGVTSTPQDAVQAIMRARRVKEVTVHVPRGRGRAITVKHSLEGAQALENYEAAALGETTHGNTCGSYERLRAEVESQRSYRQADYKMEFVREGVKLGFNVTCDVLTDLSAAKLEKRAARRAALNEAGLARFVDDRATAARIDDDEATRIEAKYSPTQAEGFALEQYQLRVFYGLPNDVSDTELREMLRQDDDGALRRQVVNYEGLIEPQRVAEARARGEHDAGVLKGDARGYMLRHAFHQQLGTVVGLDATTEADGETWEGHEDDREVRLLQLRATRENATNQRKHQLDKEIVKLEREVGDAQKTTLSTRYSKTSTSVKAFVRWCRKNYLALRAAGLMTCTLEHLTSKPVEVIGDALRRCGLCHVNNGATKARTYAVTFASVTRMWNLSRPRRGLWESMQQTSKKACDNPLLHKTRETPSVSDEVPNDRNITDQPKPFSAASVPAPARTVVMVSDHTHPWRLPGYEALRAYTRVQATGPNRERLLESFVRADSGDRQAQDAIVAYLQRPAVQQLLGGAA